MSNKDEDLTLYERPTTPEISSRSVSRNRKKNSPKKTEQEEQKKSSKSEDLKPKTIKPISIISVILRLVLLVSFTYFYLEWTPSWIFVCLLTSIYIYDFVYFHVNKKSKIYYLYLIIMGLSILLITDFTFKTILYDNYDDVHFSRVSYQNISAEDGSMAKVVISIRYPIEYQVNPIIKLITTLMQPQPQVKLSQDVNLYYREKSEISQAWIKSETVSLSAENDYTQKVILNNLKPDTNFEYSWILQDKGNINILKFYNNGRLSSTYTGYQQYFTFKTFPSADTNFSFVFGSCMKADFPYSFGGILGFKEINKHRRDFQLLLGDTIYVDVTINLGTSVADYRTLYRQLFAFPESVEYISETTLAIFDDHEILNDWRYGQENPYYSATQAFREYFPNDGQTEVKERFDFVMNYGSATFFVSDTRSFRNIPINSTSNYDTSRTMLGKAQLDRLFDWLNKSKGYKMRFIVTSVPFTLNFGSGDTWYGYAHERQEILNYISSSGIKNVFFLSGDRHQLAIVDFLKVSEESSEIIATEFSVSPINQFFLPVSMFYSDRSVEVEGRDKVQDKTLFYSANVDRTVVGKISYMKEINECDSDNRSNGGIVFCAYLQDLSRNQNKSLSSDKIKYCNEEGIVITEILKCLT